MPFDFQLIAFDLDDTLAPSKSPVPTSILEHLASLLDRVPVAIISGGNYEQFVSQLLTPLQEYAENSSRPSGVHLERLHLLPTCGTRYYRHQQGNWEAVYEEHLSAEERAAAVTVLEQEATTLGLWEAHTWGDIIEDRGSQITFSALGQQAPVAAKVAWDPTGTKKNALREAVALRLPHLEVRSGGSTSVDITRKGIDKAYGMRKLSDVTGIALTEMFFIGDRLDADGNDYPVLTLGVPCHAVDGWESTDAYLAKLLG